MTSKISIPFKFECIQSLPLCQPNRIYSVYFKFVISSYAFWSFFFPNGYMIQRLELLENRRLQGLQSQIPRPGHKSKEWESLKTKEKKTREHLNITQKTKSNIVLHCIPTYKIHTSRKESWQEKKGVINRNSNRNLRVKCAKILCWFFLLATDSGKKALHFNL